MGVTQYIGPRIIPIVANPMEWSAQQEYEPLTVVLYEGNSYTSRQYVPKDIKITDTRFWAPSGNYSAQTEAYRQETRRVSDKYDTVVADTKAANEAVTKEVADRAAAVDAERQARTEALSALDTKVTSTTDTLRTDLTKQVTDQLKSQNDKLTQQMQTQNETLTHQLDTQNTQLTGRIDEAVRKIGSQGSIYDADKVVCIGDSWGVGTDGGETPGWVNKMGTVLGASKVHNYSKGQVGFACTVSGVNFLSLAHDAVNAGHKDAQFVILAGGINDIGWGDAKTRTTEVLTYVLQQFKDAQVWVFPVLLAGRFICGDMEVTRQRITSACNGMHNKRVHCVNDCYDWLYDDSTFHFDDYHPSASGYQRVMENMLMCINGGQVSNGFGYAVNTGDVTLSRSGNVATLKINSGREFGSSDTIYKLPIGYSPAAGGFLCLHDVNGGSHLCNYSRVTSTQTCDIYTNGATIHQIYDTISWPIEDKH